MVVPGWQGSRAGQRANRFKRHLQCLTFSSAIEEYYPAFITHLAAQCTALPEAAIIK